MWIKYFPEEGAPSAPAAFARKKLPAFPLTSLHDGEREVQPPNFRKIRYQGKHKGEKRRSS